MKFIVVTQGFKAIGLLRPNPLPKPKEPPAGPADGLQGLDNGLALQSDTSADGAEFEFDAGDERPQLQHVVLVERVESAESAINVLLGLVWTLERFSIFTIS